MTAVAGGPLTGAPATRAGIDRDTYRWLAARAQKLVAIQSVRALGGAQHADVSGLGIALSATSLVVMLYLAGALLLGLLGNAAFGAWWLDPIVGLLIAAVALKEGREAWCGEGCGCAHG